VKYFSRKTPLPRFALPDRLARTVGTKLSDDTFLEWYSASSGEIVGQTLTDAAVRDRTGVSVIAIQRGEFAPPDPTATLEAVIRWSSLGQPV